MVISLIPLIIVQTINHGNLFNPINHSSDEISNSAANKINRLKLIPEADKKIMAIIVIPLIPVQTNNHSNHCNPINPGSDKIVILAYRNFLGGGELKQNAQRSNSQNGAYIVI
jgi:hypothetical protein